MKRDNTYLIKRDNTYLIRLIYGITESILK